MSNEISKKDRNVCKTVSYIEHFLILTSTITGCVPSSAFVECVPSFTQNGRIMVLSKFSVCNSKKLKFRKEQ